MHPAAVTNHHCIVYLGLGSPGVIFTTEYGEVCVCLSKEHTVWVGRRVDGWHFPFFFFFDTQPRNRQSRHVMLHGTVGMYT